MQLEPSTGSLEHRKDDINVTGGLLTLKNSFHAVKEHINASEGKDKQHEAQAPGHGTPAILKKLHHGIVSSQDSLNSKVLQVNKKERNGEENEE
ncbi:hypothetical protein DER44DRAFT_815561 [Fusarium oxysporum]|nr:hypothetical protein DER44DRAFT_815561 [Fusarium oxysporum]